MSDTAEHTANVLRDLMPDDHKHGNHLRVPEFGILDLRLKVGAKESRFFLPVDARKAPKHLTGDEAFHFAPVKETIDILYEVDDPFRVVTGGLLEGFTRFDEKPLFAFYLLKLGLDWLRDGKHSVNWDGRVVVEEVQAGTEAGDAITHDLTKIAPVAADAAKPLPDGYVTLEHTPYKLRLTLTSETLDKQPAVAWTYFQILLQKIELELGTEPTVPQWGDATRLARDRAVRKQVEDDGGLPAEGATRKVYLRSNVFKTANPQMSDNTAFTEYKTLWGDGPSIPIIAKLRLADSADAEVKLEEANYGLVLGHARFLWDWEDVAEALGGQPAAPAAFIGAAVDYYKAGTDATRPAKDHTYPKGDNCHVDRGGKRGPDGTGVFSVVAGYTPQDPLKDHDFPFKTERCTTWRWAVFTRGWATGALNGRTGVLFRGSRMAGDPFKVWVHLDYDRTAKDKPVVDVKTEPLKTPDAVHAKTGTFQFWRRVIVARYIRKLGTIADWTANFATAKAFYTPAFIDLVNSTGSSKYLMAAHKLADGTAANYNALTEAILLATGDAAHTNHLAHDAVADHAADAAIFRLRPYAGYVRAAHDSLNPGFAADFASDAEATALGARNMAPLPVDPKNTRLRATQGLMRAAGMDTMAKFSNTLDLSLPLAPLIGRLQTLSGGGGGGGAAGNGITVVHFTYIHSGVAEAAAAGVGVTVTNGEAIDVTDANRNRCVFYFTQPNTDTFVHEIGHHLFLPHSKYKTLPGGVTRPAYVGAPGVGVTSAGGFRLTRHDDDDNLCTMSYNRPRTYFCGLCQLRLRGWSADAPPGALSQTDADNKKP